MSWKKFISPRLPQTTSSHTSSAVRPQPRYASSYCPATASVFWGAVAALNTKPELLRELDLPEGYTPCCAVAPGKTDEVYSLREIPEDRIRVRTIE